ncbi:HAD-superfamily phosphatase [Rhizodiscina lignyota]|uniref:HAD-superfamily phosphatase n=1 Tax=Rhizodiscina lignyota TaxID=1504668 RepID=A0A9P4MB23_9PEZI|nr:HAD-superfamily phosphatase [Rhizodiscina lignyota]
MNLSGTVNVFRLVLSPTLCLPHHTISTFNQLPVPLSKAFPTRNGEEAADIRAVILDKDNCFAEPHSLEVYEPYRAKFKELREAYPGSRLLIVSNTAGSSSDPGGVEAEKVEKSTGVRVLRHSVKKPGCRDEILDYFQKAPDVSITSPSQIAVVGDRLFTDVMMANLMGARGVWVRDGVVKDSSIFAGFERGLASFLFRRGYYAPIPRSDFE